METPLLATKLFIPPVRPGLVPRPRLMERLQTVLHRSLTLVSAPAGFGKTTVLTQWVNENTPEGGAAWFSLDEGDNDPVRFWDYLIAAIEQLIPEADRTTSSMLHASEAYATEAVLTALINKLASVSSDLVVVLDDYHLIKAEAVHAGVAFLLDHLPPRMHVIIATRTDPALPMARFRGRGMLLEMGADDLRFTLDEATGLLRDTLGSHLLSEDVAALNVHTEGWAAGLKMAALSLRGQDDIRGFVRSFAGTQRYVMDYLVEEVLKNQSDDVRDFLLKTSILEKLANPLCTCVTERTHGQDMLSKLDRSNLFLMPLDSSGQWYRYHHLFAELLRHQLAAASGPEMVARLHQRASQWYEDNGFPDDAIHHALAARDWERAIGILTSISEDRLKRGEMMTLLAWLRAVPEDVLRTHLSLYRHYASMLVKTGQLNAANEALGYLERAASDDLELQGEVATGQAEVSYQCQELPRSVELARRALHLLPPYALALRAKACFTLGNSLYEIGLYDDAWPVLTEAVDTGKRACDLLSAIEATGYLTRILWHRGQLHRMADVSQEAIELGGQSSPTATQSWMRLGHAFYEWNDLEQAERNQRVATRLAKLRGYPAMQVTYHTYLARTLAARGDRSGAASELATADALMANNPVRLGNKARSVAYHGLVALMVDDLATALQWKERLLLLKGALPFECRHLLSRLLIAGGERSAAMEQLKEYYLKLEGEHAQGLMVETRVYQALAASTGEEAVTFLAEALIDGQPEGYIRTFVDEGKLLAPLLRQALAQGITPDYTRKLLDIIEHEDRLRQARMSASSMPQSSGVLTDRELEILRLLESGLSNRQIAARLIITLGTAKTHIHNIFEKLGAKTRTQAVSRARQLKLI